MNELSEEVLVDIERLCDQSYQVMLVPKRMRQFIAAARRCKELEAVRLAAKKMIDIAAQRHSDELEYCAAGQTHSYGEYIGSVATLSRLIAETERKALEAK